jgi:hypothetical protein
MTLCGIKSIYKVFMFPSEKQENVLESAYNISYHQYIQTAMGNRAATNIIIILVTEKALW